MSQHESSVSAPSAFAEIGAPIRQKANQLRVLEETNRAFHPILYWYLTFRCNLACKHCSVQSSPWVDNSGDLTTADCMAVIDQLVELNVKSVLMSGGEALIRPDTVEIISELGRRKIGVSLETNGLRFDRKFFAVAKELQDRNLFAMTISLDGGTKETHEALRGPRSFDGTVRGLRALKEHDIKFNVQCVLNKTNFPTIPNLYRLAQELYPQCAVVQWSILGATGRGIGLMKQLGLSGEDFRSIFELVQAHKHQYQGRTMIKVPPAVVPPQHLPMVFKESNVINSVSCQFPLLGILPNGDVTICAVSRKDEELRFGNIRTTTLKKVWTETRMSMLRNRYLESTELKGICGDCIWKYSCKGSCRAWAYEEGDSFDSPFPVCQALFDNGEFPQAYRLSSQNAFARDWVAKKMPCGCNHS